MSNNTSYRITPQVLLKAYSCGIFPMAESAEDPSLFWVEPEERGILPLDQFHLSRSLAKTVKQDRFQVRVNCDFDAVIENCAAIRPDRTETWINQPIRQLYRALFDMGHCHTVEVYNEAGALVGGLYGVHLGAAFFGESMFSGQRDASKVALVHLVARLLAGKFWLLDTQFTTDHLKRFGTIDVPRSHYQLMLEDALVRNGDFFSAPESMDGAQAVSLIREYSVGAETI